MRDEAPPPVRVTCSLPPLPSDEQQEGGAGLAAGARGKALPPAAAAGRWRAAVRDEASQQDAGD